MVKTISMSGEKDRLRFELQNALRVLSVGERHAMSSRMQQHLLQSDVWAGAGTILLYSALPGEPRTVELLKQGRAEGKTICYPKVSSKNLELTFYRVADAEALQRGTFGILEPRPDPESRISPSEIQLALIPGLGFDTSGNRLGRGMGYYDRFLGSGEFTGMKIGCCYSCQLVDSLPTDAHDIPVERLLSEKGLQILAK
jgi:5-formyltetrahydrofolate cyclo-ligase